MRKIFVSISIIFGIAGLAHAEDAKPTVNPRYVINGGTVYDKKTGRTWQRCSVGQHWKNGDGCVGIVKSFTFDEAQKPKEKGWRIPSKDELASLIDYGRKTQNQPPMIDELVFPDMNVLKMVYWSSTPFDAADGYFVDFHDGNIDNDSRKTANALRLVRGKE